MIAVSEGARNIVCSGGQPLAITNCLNFGNPYNPEVYWQFVHVIKGMGEACIKFNTPVTGGNVSFYNQSQFKGENGKPPRTEPVYPTPTIGMLGLLKDASNQMTLGFKSAKDIIYLIGTSRNDLNCSEYLREVCNVQKSPAPYFDLEEEHTLQKVTSSLISNRLVNSVHDISEGGLFVCLMECAMVGNLGFSVSSDQNVRKDAFLFGESQSRIIISVAPGK